MANLKKVLERLFSLGNEDVSNAFLILILRGYQRCVRIICVLGKRLLI